MEEQPTTANALVASEEPEDEELSPREVWWRNHQVWLQETGYLLRLRYRPGWVPSWKGTDRWSSDCEDGYANR